MRAAHPAGPLHGDQLHAHAPVRRRPTPPPWRALDPRGLVGRRRRATRDGVLTRRRARRPRPRRARTARPLLSSTRPTSGRGAGAFRAAFARRRRLLRGQGVPLRRASRAGSPRRGSASTSAPAASSPSRCAPGFPPERIALHGNNKSRRRARGRASTPGSAGSSSTRSRRSPGSASSPTSAACGRDVLVRVTVGVEAHTHEFIATAHEDQKFGFSLASGDAAEAVRRVLALPSLRAGRPALPHRLADLRHRRLRGRGAPRRRAGRRRSATSTASSSPSSTSAAASGIAYVAATTRPTSPAVAAALRAIVERECAGVRPARAAAVGRAGPRDRRAAARSRSTRSARSSRSSSTAATTATYVSVDGGMSDNIRTALYDADYTVHARVARLGRPARCSPASSASTARAATSSSRTRGCPPTSRPATCSRSRPPARTAGRWPPTTTTCRAAGGRASRRGRARVLLRRETVEDLLALDPGA